MANDSPVGRKWSQAPVVVKDWAFIQAAFGAVICLMALLFGQSNTVLLGIVLAVAIVLMVTFVKANRAGWYLQILWSGFVLSMAGLMALELVFGWEVYPGGAKDRATFGRLLYVIANAIIFNGWFAADVKQWFGMAPAPAGDADAG